jgi:UDP-3-O-[3-hydroxymyristoyl] N-acetylglucosamine deacetylase / 3-hydroxyacyl-[acyl-carrier-protein] dehydratase
MEKQKTIKTEKTLKGVGLHTGNEVIITFKPAPVNTGFVFIRTDIDGNPKVEAHSNYVTTTDRGTTLEKNGIIINTTEHVLAALVGLDIDNVYIEISNSEPPIMDGSSKFFIEIIEEAGIEVQSEPRDYFVVKEVISLTDPETGSEITAFPSDTYEIITMVDFGTKILGTQNAELKNINDFKAEISSARTFSFLHELEQLIDAGLIRGGDLSNAIIYVDKQITPETEEKLKKIFNKSSITTNPNGILDNLTLHYSNEAARHKLLDVIGDLALIGKKIKGKIIANKPGHKINTLFAKKISKLIKEEKRKKSPKFDLNKEPVYNINQIMSILPHRPPFLLIDKIMEISPNYVIGVKNVTMNEPFFTGHFPQEPVMPGVLQIEAMAQAGGILALHGQEEPHTFSTYFIKIDKVKFKKKVVPGDTLIFNISLTEPIRRGIVHMQGYGHVGSHLVVEAEMMAQIIKNKN